MSPEAAEYVAAFLTDSLGLAQGALPPGQVPSDLAELLVAALSGREDSASDQPILEQKIQAFLGQFEEATLDRRGYLLRKARWPGGASYAACLTHDVDNLSRPMGHIVKIRGRFSAADFWLSLLGLRSLYDNLAYTAALEESRNLRSSFYFLSSNYDLSKISARVRRLSEGGWDMGLHGDFGTHDSAEKMAAAVAAFKEKTGLTPRGLREHFLQFDYAKTWGIIDAQGFEYDTSVGNRDRLGFRLGLCTPFHPPDSHWRPMRSIELPLVLMDTTLWGYLKRTEEEGMRDFSSLRERVRQVEGLYTVLWHQEAMRMKGGRLYPLMLDALVKDGCFVAPGAVLAKWWRERSAPMQLGEKELSMDTAPAGLRLRFKAKEEMRLSLGGGLETKAIETVVRAPAGALRLRVS